MKKAPEPDAESAALLLDRLACRVVLTGRQSMSPNWAVPERTLRCHDVLRVTQGETRFCCAGRSYAARAPCWILLPAGLPHAFDGHTGLAVSVIHFECILGDGMDALRLLRPETDPLPIIPAAAGAVFEAAVDAWKQPEPLGRTLANRWMELWFLQAFGAPAGRVTLDPRLNKVLAWLYTEPPASFNLQAAARRAGISASHLRNLFQRYFGISPKTMVQGVRFTEARRLLESSELTVAEIAYRTGWKDATAFTKSFRKRFGLPPFEFRQARRGHLL